MNIGIAHSSAPVIVRLDAHAVAERGILGAFTGGFTSSAAGICAALVFGYLAALIFKPKEK